MEPRTDGVSNTLTSVQKDNLLVEPVRIKANTQKGYEEVGEYGAVNISRPGSTTRRGRIQGDKGDIIGTLLTGEENAVLEPNSGGGSPNSGGGSPSALRSVGGQGQQSTPL